MPDQTPDAAAPPRGRRWLLGALLALLVAVAIELLSLALYRGVTGHGFGYASAAAARRAVGETAGERPAGRTGVPSYVANKSIHPYVGYVVDRFGPDGKPNPGVSPFGYLDDAPPVHHRSPDRLLVGVVGGSVAMGFARSPAAERVLRERLAADPVLHDRRLELVRLAISGYHQPQQLMTLAYLLSLGAEFDVIINIDGFNEVALYPAENARFGVFPAYPRAWYLHVADLPLGLTGGYSYALERQRRFARLFSGALGYSVTANLVWVLGNRMLAADVAQAREELMRARKGPVNFAATGPPRRYAGPAPMLDDLVALWQRSSLQLDHLCRANGIRYLHFLQPNQYDAGSKPMGPAERAVAFNPQHPFRPGAERGYPLLRRAGDQLRAEGVAFHDLSGLFAGVEEPLYIDTCCHFDEKGFELMAGAVADALTTADPQP